MNRYLPELKHITNGRIRDIHPSSQNSARVAGIVTNIRTRQTKRGDRFAILTLDDGTATIEVVCFSECYQEFRPLIADDLMVIVEGEVSMDDFSNSARIVAKQLSTIDQARARQAKAVLLNLTSLRAIQIEPLQNMLAEHAKGPCPVILQCLVDNVQAQFKLGKQWCVKPSDAFIKAVHELMPGGQVEFIYE